MRSNIFRQFFQNPVMGQEAGVSLAGFVKKGGWGLILCLAVARMGAADEPKYSTLCMLEENGVEICGGGESEEVFSWDTDKITCANISQAVQEYMALSARVQQLTGIALGRVSTQLLLNNQKFDAEKNSLLQEEVSQSMDYVSDIEWKLLDLSSAIQEALPNCLK